jgi:hypothetical protein
VFFNHEQSDPELWLHSAKTRLASECEEWPRLSVKFHAPAGARLNGLAFTIIGSRGRAPTGPGWITGLAKLGTDGKCHVEAECGLDPSLANDDALEAARAALESEIKRQVGHVFGWEMEAAA